MNRLLTRRDKGGTHPRSKSSEPGSKRPSSANPLASMFRTPEGRKVEKDGVRKDDEEGKKIQDLKRRLWAQGITGLDESHIEFALQTKYASGNPDRALEMLELFQDSVEGIVRPYRSEVYMKGAENREAVTCYLDALLFAMFARLGSFEPILYTKFDDEPRKRLSTLIRLWVNMLRTGKLIQTDITKQLQEALAACGWENAVELEQQDTSEAFSFITETLKLPLLTLEMDMFHEGKEDAADDHKFVNERLLEVAIPEDTIVGAPVRLEDCLEEHFNARVEIVRQMSYRRNTLQRSNTRSSVQSGLSNIDEKDGVTEHVERVESPILEDPHQLSVSSPSDPDFSGRRRAPSIIRSRILGSEERGGPSSIDATSSGRSKTGSVRKEVLMPAWQFFRIIPWYTAVVPTNDAQVAAHFNSTRPVLGICLKRYAMTNNGTCVRRNTPIDIPLQIALPHFIQDDKSSDDGPLFGNFNLVLQSMVCHRGNSVHAGHYISFVRGNALLKDQMPMSTAGVDEPPEYSEDRWIKFDDLADERVSYADIEKVLSEEMPYLLFYQVRPLFEDDASTPSEPGLQPPSYEASGIGMNVVAPSPITPAPSLPAREQNSYFGNEPTTEDTPKRISFSDDVDRPRTSLNLADRSRRNSLAWTEASSTSASMMSTPVTPGEDPSVTNQGRLSRATSRFRSSKSKSRPHSHVDENRGSLGENRLSGAFSRLTMMRSKEPLLGKTVEVPPADASNADVSSNNTAMTLPHMDPQTVELSTSAPSEKDQNGLAPKTSPAEVIDKEKDVLVLVGIGRNRSKRGKNKLNDLDLVIGTSDTHHHHFHKGKVKLKDGTEVDRECVVM